MKEGRKREGRRERRREGEKEGRREGGREKEIPLALVVSPMVVGLKLIALCESSRGGMTPHPEQESWNVRSTPVLHHR